MFESSYSTPTQAGIEAQDSFRLTIQRKPLRCSVGCLDPQDFRFERDDSKGGCEGLGRRRNHAPGSSQDVASLRGIRCNYVCTRGKRLSQNEPLRFGDARHSERIGAGVEVGKFLAGDRTEEAHLTADVALARKRGEPEAQRTLAGEYQLQRWIARARQRAHE